MERLLPDLLQRCLDRSWRALILTGSQEQQKILDDILWTYKKVSFLPHGTDQDANPEDCPLLLTTTAVNFNKAQVAFFLEGIKEQEMDFMKSFQRSCFLYAASPMPELFKKTLTTMKDDNYATVLYARDAKGQWCKTA